MQKFINPSSLVYQVGLHTGDVVADFGCGSGFYSLPAAQMVGNVGSVFAVDIQESKLAATQSIARQMGYRNVQAIRADLDKPIQEMPQGSCDAVILANILHEAANTKAVIENAYRVLKTGGHALVVEWKKEYTPLGPGLEKRFSEAEAEAVFTKMGFRLEKDLDSAVDTYHYAKVFVK